MYVETDGIVLRQVKTLNGRRMLSILTRKFGKISAGSSLTERSRGKSALATRPFTHGRYELYKNRDQYSLSSAETLRSFYGIGEDVDKFMAASFILEYSDKIAEEGLPNTELFKLLADFLELMEKREKRHGTLVCGFMLRSFEIMGVGIDFTEDDIDKGGLIFKPESDIVGAMEYMAGHELKNLENLALGQEHCDRILRFCEKYAAYHLETGELKSKDFLI